MSSKRVFSDLIIAHLNNYSVFMNMGPEESCNAICQFQYEMNTVITIINRNSQNKYVQCIYFIPLVSTSKMMFYTLQFDNMFVFDKIIEINYFSI